MVLRRIGPWSLALVLTLAACARGEPAEDRVQATDANGNIAPAVTPAPSTDADSEELAALGAELFTSKGCPACHTIGGGRLVGPDLEGVTERRSREWIIAMIMHPDSMLRNDETARELLAEYFTPMAPLNITDQQASALHTYLSRATP